MDTLDKGAVYGGNSTPLFFCMKKRPGMFQSAYSEVNTVNWEGLFDLTDGQT